MGSVGLLGLQLARFGGSSQEGSSFLLYFLGNGDSRNGGRTIRSQQVGEAAGSLYCTHASYTIGNAFVSNASRIYICVPCIRHCRGLLCYEVSTCTSAFTVYLFFKNLALPPGLVKPTGFQPGMIMTEADISNLKKLVLLLSAQKLGSYAHLLGSNCGRRIGNLSQGNMPRIRPFVSAQIIYIAILRQVKPFLEPLASTKLEGCPSGKGCAANSQPIIHKVPL